ncbi:MAG: hypothetical protein ACLRSW_14755 [Christensenellaceae bacterium]
MVTVGSRPATVAFRPTEHQRREGKHYVATLRMKASRARTVMLEIGAQQVQLTSRPNIRISGRLYRSFSAGVRFNIQLGGGGSENNNSVIYVDSVAMASTRIKPSISWQMFNPEYDHGSETGAMSGNVCRAGRDDSYVAAEIPTPTRRGVFSSIGTTALKTANTNWLSGKIHGGTRYCRNQKRRLRGNRAIPFTTEVQTFSMVYFQR